MLYAPIENLDISALYNMFPLYCRATRSCRDICSYEVFSRVRAATPMAGVILKTPPTSFQARVLQVFHLQRVHAWRFQEEATAN